MLHLTAQEIRELEKMFKDIILDNYTNEFNIYSRLDKISKKIDKLETARKYSK